MEAPKLQYTDGELDLIRAINDERVKFEGGTVRLLIPRFTWTYGSAAFEKENPLFSRLAASTLYSAETAIKVVDKKKDEIDEEGDALDSLLHGKNIHMLFTEVEYDLPMPYDPVDVLDDAITAYFSRFQELNGMFLVNNISGLPELMKQGEVERKQEILTHLHTDKITFQKALKNYNYQDVGENTELVHRAIVYMETEAREKINNADNPRTQSNYNLLTLLQLRYFLGLDNDDLDALVIGMDLKNVRENNKEVSEAEVDQFLTGVTKALSDTSRTLDYGLRKHGDGGDELLLIMYFGRDENHTRESKGVLDFSHEELEQIVQKKAKLFTFASVKNQLRYIQEQVDSGRYELVS